MFILMLLGIIIFTLLFGQKIILPILIYLYLTCWGSKSRVLAITYSVITWALHVLFFDRIINLAFYMPIIQKPIEEILPNNFPIWLLF